MKDKLEKKGELYRKVDDGALTLGYKRDTFVRETVIKADKKGEVERGRLRVQGEAAAPVAWSVSFDVVARGRRADIDDLERPRTATSAPQDTGAATAAWRSGSPAPRAWSRPGSRCIRSTGAAWSTWRRCASRPASRPGALPAAGLPWFMAMFGRDSLITSFQALPFAPELAATTLRALALFQAPQRRSVPRRGAGQDPARAPARRDDRVRGAARTRPTTAPPTRRCCS